MGNPEGTRIVGFLNCQRTTYDKPQLFFQDFEPFFQSFGVKRNPGKEFGDYFENGQVLKRKGNFSLNRIREKPIAFKI
ncbi:hypothetical protein B0E43_02870 [Algoriphagus sp. A40]|nr:hypothetical protein B0E43_02870 [Algoriphagus sp. A40]